jgi:hypothetical protein
MKKMTVVLSDKEDKYFNNCDSTCWCYWDIIGLFKKTEDALAGHSIMRILNLDIKKKRCLC